MRSSIATLVVAGSLLVGFAASPSPNEPRYAAAAAVKTSCERDGVRVDWIVGYSSSPAPAGYRVSDVRVSGISKACLGAELSVALTEGGIERARGGRTSITGGTEIVPMNHSMLASSVDGVHLAITKTTNLRPPARCASESFRGATTGTRAADELRGTRFDDLIVGLTRNDKLVGFAGGDCLAGQSGADRLLGGGGADILLGGPGRDACIGGRGRDVLLGCEPVGGRT